MGDPYPYIREGEINASFWALPDPGLGKPGLYIDNGLYEVPGPAFAPLFSPTTRMTQDANAAAVQADKPANLWSIFTNTAGAFKGATDDLIGAITHTWSDPDTGQVNFGTGPDVGRKWTETVGTMTDFLQQMPGLFNTGYDPAPGQEPVIPAMPAAQTAPALGGIPAWAILAVVLLLAMGRRS